MPYHNFTHMNVAIKCHSGMEVKRLLLSLGILADYFDNQLRQDWDVIITDQGLYESVPSQYLRIVLSDDPIKNVEGQIIRIPQKVDLTTLHFALVNAAESLNIQEIPYY